jgi:hypothetical protein
MDPELQKLLRVNQTMIPSKTQVQEKTHPA